ncbi:MAG: cytochrome C oxidase subunit IV family protein [Dehalococcoidia bacterium]
MSHAEQAELGTEQHGLTIRQYLMIGAALTVITIIELAVSYSDLGDAMVPILLILSAVKFVVVVAYFMHLRFDAPIFTRMFVGSFFLALAILIALVSLFWADDHRLPLG